jgi:predicted Holliday junction resolvase-like endonuclease
MAIALLDLFVLIIVIGAIMFLATQVIIPLMRGTVLFPMFGAGEAAEKAEIAEHQLEEIAEQERLQELTEEINRRKAKLKEGNSQ